MHPISRSLGAVAALVALPGVHAHEDVPAPSHVAGAIVITGSQPSSLPTTLPTTLEGLTAAEIERSVNATDSEDALKYLPSLLVRKRYIGDYNHAVLSTRASGTGNSARSLVYADGILLSNLLGNGATFAPRWGLVTPEEIARVDVLYGPFSAAYPGNSVGAVVDYVTRMPQRFEAHAKVGGFMQPFDLYGTHATYRGWQASASLGNKAGALAWWVNVNRLDSEGQPLVFVTRLQSDGSTGNTVGTAVSGAVPGLDPRNRPQYILGTTTQYHTLQDHAKLKLAYDIDTSLRAHYVLGWWGNRAAGSSESWLRDSDGSAIYSGGIHIDGRDYTSASQRLSATAFSPTRDSLSHVMQALSLRRHSHGTFGWEIAASRYDYQRDLQRTPTIARPDADAGGAGRITDQHGTGWGTLSLKGVWRPSEQHVIDGGVQQEHYRFRNVGYGTVDWNLGDAGSVMSRFQGDTRLTSVFAQDSWRFAPRWNGVLGLRAERWQAWNGMTQQAVSPAPVGASCTGSLCSLAHPQRSDSSASPKLAIGFDPTADWTLKASVGRAVRWPTVSELYQGGINNLGQQVNTNPDLRPERSWTVELSAQHNGDSLQWRVTPFFENTHDALYAQLNTATNTNTVQNVDHVRTTGLESALQAQDVFLRGLDLSGSLTCTRSKVVADSGYLGTPGDVVGKDQVRVPRWRASLLATWRVDDRLSATLGARYGSRQYSQLNNADVNGFAYTAASKYAVVDLRLLWRIDRRFSAAFGIDNLNNYKYWNFHPYPQRTFSGELKYDL
ncbi:MAG TPA: TonB-dependent receptor [Burkholderiaceae bacterium]|nr:TonB-dependent receptor [Burkholderiaceae bacterium]